MGGSCLPTEADLSRARKDPAFRHKLVSDNLERLLATLNRLRSAGPDPKQALQIREGVDLAVQLADLLQRIASERGGQPRSF